MRACGGLDVQGYKVSSLGLVWMGVKWEKGVGKNAEIIVEFLEIVKMDMYDEEWKDMYEITGDGRRPRKTPGDSWAMCDHNQEKVFSETFLECDGLEYIFTRAYWTKVQRIKISGD